MAQMPRNKRLNRRRPVVPSGPRPPITDIPRSPGSGFQSVHQFNPVRNGGKGNKGGKKGSKGSGGKGGSGSGKGGGGYFGGYGGFKGVKKRKVNRLVNGMIRSEVKDLRRVRAQVRNESKRDMQSVRRDYRRGKGDLEHIFGETGDYIQHLQGLNADSYNTQLNQTQAANAALQQQLGGTYSGAQDQVNAEMERLGIQGAGNLSGLIADQANAQAMASQAGANAEQTMGMAAGNTQQLMNLMQGMNQGSFQQAMGQNLNTRNEQLTQVRDDRRDKFNDIRRAIRDVRGGRRDLFFQLLNQLQETGWSQYMDQQQLNMAKRAQRRNR